MARKTNKIVIPFSFEEEGNTLKDLKNNLQSVTKELNGSVGKTLSKNITDSFSQVVKDINKTFTKSNKPVFSKKEAIDLGNTISSSLKKGHQVALQLKETLQKAFDPKMAKEASESISSLEKKLVNLNSAREKWSSLTAASRGSGDAGKINRTIKQDTNRKNELLTARQNGSITKEEKEELKEINARLKENNALLEQKKKIEAELTELKKETGKATAAALDEEISQTKELITETRNSTLLTEDYNKMAESLDQLIDRTGELSDKNEDLGERGGQSFSEMKEAIAQADENTKKLSQTLKELTGFGIGINELIRGFKQLVREAFNFYKSLDQALTDITIVSNLSRSQVQALTADFISLSRQTGMAIDDIAQASVIFFQQGLTTNEVMEMTEVTAQFAKVAGSTVEKAADQLTAAINGYKVGVEGAIDVADKLNAVAAKSAASIDELATAMSKAASQANQAGLSMDKFYAIIGTIEEVTREAPENIGTSLKTIMARMQQIKEGNNTEDDTDVNAVETALRSVGIRLRDNNGQLKDLEEVLDELGPKWAGLDRNTQAYLGTIIAGTRQQSRFISMMQNWDRVLELTEVSQNSSGQQAVMHKKAMEGLDAAINTLRNSWQEFLTTLTNSDEFIKILKTAAQLLQNITKNTNLPNLLAKAASLFVIMNKGKLINTFKQIGSTFKDLPKTLKQTVSLMGEWHVNAQEQKQLQEGIAQAEKKVAEYTDQLNKSKERTLQLQAQLANLSSMTPEQRQQLINDLNVETQSQNMLTQQIDEQNGIIKQNKDAIEGNIMTTEEYANSMTTMMASVQMATMALSSFMEVLNIAPEAGQAVTGVMQIAAGAVGTFGSIAKAVDDKTKISAPLIYAILTGGIMLISGIVALGKALDSMADTSGKIRELDNNMKELNKEYVATATEIKGMKDYLSTYDELSKKIILTTEEQEKLNEAIEGMAELGDIEYWTDEEGHNHIRREQVEKAIDKKEQEKEEKQEEMRDTARKKLYNEYREDINYNGSNDKYFSKKAQEKGLYTVTVGPDNDIYYFQTEEDAENFRQTLLDYSARKEGVTYDDVKAAGSKSSNFGNKYNPYKNQHNLGENSISTGTVKADLMETYAIDQVYGDYIDTLTDFYEGSDTLGKSFNKALQQQIVNRDKMEELYTDGDRWDVENYVKEQDDKMKEFYATDFGKETMDKGVKFYQDMINESGGDSLDKITENIDAFYQTMIDKLDKNDKDYETKLEAIKAQREATKSGLYEQYGFDAQMVKDNGLSNYSASSLGAMSKIGMFDGGDGANQILEQLKTGEYAQNINDAFAVSDENGLRELYKTLYDITGEMEEIPEDAKTMMTEVEKQLGTTVTTPWSKWADDFEDITKESRKFAEIMRTVREEGGMSIDQFGEMMSMVDGLADSFMNMGDLDSLQNLTDAINQMDFAIDASTSTIKVNGDATKAMANMQNALTKAKIQAKINELHAQEEELTAQRDGLVVYAQLLKQKIEALGGSVDAEEEAAGLKIDNLNRENTALEQDLDEKGAYYKAIAGMIQAVENEEPPENIEAIKNTGTSTMKSKKVTKTTKTGSGSSTLDKYKNELSNVLTEINILDERIASVRKQQELWKKMKKVD